MPRAATKRNLWPFGEGQPLGSRSYTYDLQGAREAAAEEKRGKPKVQARYKGYTIYKTSDGEFYSSLDRDSWYERLVDVKRSIDDYKKGRGNPARNPSHHALEWARQRQAEVGFEIDAADLAEQISYHTDEKVTAADVRKWRRTGKLRAPDRENPARNPSRHALEWARQRQSEVGFEIDAADLAEQISYHTDEKVTAADVRKWRRTGKLRAPNNENPAKFDRCVRDVKARGGDVNAYAVCTAAGTRNPKGRRNPESGAAELYQSFHGKPPEETVEIHEDIEEHGWLGNLGELTEIFVDTPTGYRLQLEWTGKEDTPFLAANEDGTQLYVKGGKQSVDLAKIKMDDTDWVKDRMVLGQFSPPDPCSKCGGEFVYSPKMNRWQCSECKHVANIEREKGPVDRVHNITYRTEKDFDDFAAIDYQHALGEETGDRPTLEYDPRNELLFIAGGRYRIRKPLMETSPGIEN
jgi:hypothetical protein